jgi:hypothetical protein
MLSNQYDPYMGENEINPPRSLGFDQIRDTDIRNRDKAIENIRNIRQNSQKIAHLLSEFRDTEDLKKQALIKTKISMIIESLNGDISRGTDVLGLMRVDIEDRARQNNDPKYKYSKLRIVHAAMTALQVKMHECAKDLCRLQVRIKDAYKEKMSKQLLATDPGLNEETLAELVNDPMVD